MILPGLDRAGRPRIMGNDRRRSGASAASDGAAPAIARFVPRGCGRLAAIPGARPILSVRDRRVRLFAEALRPAAMTMVGGRWSRRHPTRWPGSRPTIAPARRMKPRQSRCCCGEPSKRQAATAALVTPTRAGAPRRGGIAPLGHRHRRFGGIAAEPDAAGRLPAPCARSSRERAGAVPLLAALKHPLAAGGLAPEVFRDHARRLEAAIRGPRPAPGFAGCGRRSIRRSDCCTDLSIAWNTASAA